MALYINRNAMVATAARSLLTNGITTSTQRLSSNQKANNIPDLNTTIKAQPVAKEGPAYIIDLLKKG